MATARRTKWRDEVVDLLKLGVEMPKGDKTPKQVLFGT